MTDAGWISLKCTWCQTRFRIKEAYAHLKGRCPECGARIAPVQHKAYEPLPVLSDVDEPAGLVPLDDEEWPEPALREREEVEVVHPTPSPATPAAPPSPGTIFALAGDGPPSTTATKPVPPPVPVGAGDEEDQFKPVAPVPTAVVPAPTVPAKVFDPLFMDDAPALTAAVPPTMSIPPSVSSAVPEDVFAAAEAKLTPAPAAEGPIITPYMFKDGAPLPSPPPEPPPLAKFVPPPATEKKPAEPARPAKPKRKKDIPPKTPAGDDPQVSSDAPSKDPDAYRLSQAELNPERAVPPPEKLFLVGVWDWPFRLEGLKAWLCIAAGAALFLFFLHQALEQFHSKTNPTLGFVFGSAMSFLCFIVVGLFGSYASAWFLAILADTANGSREVSWLGGGVVDWLGGLLRVAWVLLLAGLIALVLGVVNFFWLGFIGWGIGVLLIFPVFMLSSLASDWSWSPWHPDVVTNTFRHLKQFFTMYLLSVLLAGVIGLALWGTSYALWLSPVGGLVFAAGWLIYARLLGRFGWVVLHGEEDQPRKKKKKKRKKTTEEGGEEPEASEGTDSSLVTAQEP